jgi:hypothetical protein
MDEVELERAGTRRTGCGAQLLGHRTGPCAGQPLSGEERTVGYHDDVKLTVGV